MGMELAASFPPEFVCFLGVDWADKEHVFCLLDRGTGASESGKVASSPEELSVWMARLRERFPEGLIAVCLEGHRGGLVTFLLGYDFVVVFPINPHSSADYRDSFRPSGAKDDFADARMLLDYLIRHPEQVTPLRPDREEVRLLAGLCEGRRQAVEQRKALTNQLGACLKAYYPQALGMLGDLHSELACAFLAKWSEPEQLKAARDSQLRRFFYAQNCRGETRMDERLEAVHRAVVLTRDRAVIVPSRMKMLGFVRLVRDLNRTIAEYDSEIDRLYRQMPDHDIFCSFPGAGDAIGPRLLTAFGSDRSRFSRPEDIQCLSAIAPVTEQSGHSKWVRRRWQCNTFLHQTFHEYALHSISFSTWARLYVAAKVSNGKGYNTAIRALAYKWQRIMFACWQNHEAYDEARYFQALEKNRSPLVSHGGTPAALTQAIRA